MILPEVPKQDPKVAESPLPAGFPGDSAHTRTRCGRGLSARMQPPLTATTLSTQTRGGGGHMNHGGEALCQHRSVSLVRGPGRRWAGPSGKHSEQPMLDLMSSKTDGHHLP